jgi:hypothetical protein
VRSTAFLVGFTVSFLLPELPGDRVRVIVPHPEPPLGKRLLALSQDPDSVHGAVAVERMLPVGRYLLREPTGVLRSPNIPWYIGARAQAVRFRTEERPDVDEEDEGVDVVAHASGVEDIETARVNPFVPAGKKDRPFGERHERAILVRGKVTSWGVATHRDIPVHAPAGEYRESVGRFEFWFAAMIAWVGESADFELARREHEQESISR